MPVFIGNLSDYAGEMNKGKREVPQGGKGVLRVVRYGFGNSAISVIEGSTDDQRLRAQEITRRKNLERFFSDDGDCDK